MNSGETTGSESTTGYNTENQTSGGDPTDSYTTQQLSITCKHKQTQLHERNQHEKDMLDKKLGYIGRLFGHSDSAAKNITLFILIILILVSAIYMYVTYHHQPADCEGRHFELIWNSMIPIITLALGYLFGDTPKK